MARAIAEYSRKEPALAKSLLFPGLFLSLHTNLPGSQLFTTGIVFLCECFDVSSSNIIAFSPEPPAIQQVCEIPYTNSPSHLSSLLIQNRIAVKQDILQSLEKDAEYFIQVRNVKTWL
jgi:hypothetical protein